MATAWHIRRAPGPLSGLHLELDAAVTFIRGCRLDDALHVIEEALAAAPDDPGVCGRAHSFKGEIASIRGALDETAREYALAIADLETTGLVGSLARAHRGRAEAYLNLAMYSSALEDSSRALLLVDSITEAAVRRRAALESAICEGLIRVELSRTAAAREVWESSAALIDSDCDPLLVGLHDMLGGTALAASARDRRRGFELLERAAGHFAAHGLVYHHARALEAHARRVVTEDPSEAARLGEAACTLFDRAGAALRLSRARRWLEDVRPRTASLAPPRLAVRLDPASDAIDGIVLAGPATRSCVELALCAAATNSTVLVTGESGTGKELIARLVHQRSRRAGKPWVPFNCAAVPSEMIESILFGHRRGAFTGAHTSHDGLVRAADGGTLFLDEIGELPLTLQAKLLRFLQEGEVLPLGDTRSVRVDVRVVAATNRDLERETREGRFRSDLYHRLNVIRLQIAPLRERRDEIPNLVRRLAATIGDRLGVFGAEVTAGAVSPLLAHQWPGNVRELANCVERCLALYGPRITRESVEASLSGPGAAAVPLEPFEAAFAEASAATTVEVVPLQRAMDAFERGYVERVLAECGNNRSRSAQRLGVSLQRLRYRMRRLGMG
jgi:transcriptional regulator with GAF, ATPase, and Fis domain